VKLSDVMSAAGLAGYAEVGLCIFVAIFVAVAIRTFRRSGQIERDHLAGLPLQDERVAQSPSSDAVQG
jgi:hypothetical protein